MPCPPRWGSAWETADRLWGLTSTGDILRSADGGTSWNPAGKLAGQAIVFTANDGAMYASIHERGIFRSTDNGTTWTQLYAQT